MREHGGHLSMQPQTHLTTPKRDILNWYCEISQYNRQEFCSVAPPNHGIR
jgi:hypothetical protein